MASIESLKKYRYNPGDEIKCVKSTWTVLGRKVVMGTGRYNTTHKEYLCRCHECGSALWRTENELMQGESGKQGQGNCGVCFNRVVMTGKNDVATTHPNLVRFFKDPEDALHINAGSREKRWFKCPNCGNEFETSVEYVTNKNRLYCPVCDDGISYPNKFARSVLKQLGAEDLESEYSPDWAHKYRYDFSFYQNGRHYLLEMDGGFHFMERFGRNEKEIVNRDEAKNRLAKENGCILIRIDCQHSDLSYIRKNMESSILSTLFDMSTVDWEKVESNCCKSAVIEVNEYYLHHPNASLEEIASVCSLCKATVQTYLKRGANMGINNYETLLDTMNKNFAKVVDYKKQHLEASSIEIGDATGVEPNTVRNYLHKAKQRGLLEEIDSKKIRKDRIREYVKEHFDFTNVRLAQDMKCCTDYIQKLRKELATA